MKRDTEIRSVFSRAYDDATLIEYTGRPTKFLDIQLDQDEVICFTDYKDRRVIIYGTILDNVIVCEEKSYASVTASDAGIDSFKLLTHAYKLIYRSVPLSHILPNNDLSLRELLFICGDGDTIPNISARVVDFIDSIDEFTNKQEAVEQ